jgi:hypothetical protein
MSRPHERPDTLSQPWHPRSAYLAATFASRAVNILPQNVTTASLAVNIAALAVSTGPLAVSISTLAVHAGPPAVSIRVLASPFLCPGGK